MSIVTDQIYDLAEMVIMNFKEKFHEYPVFDSYPEYKKIKSYPAIFIVMTDFNQGDGVLGTGQTRITTRWEFRAVAKTAEHYMARTLVASLAAEASHFVQNASWIDETQFGCQFISAEDDNFDHLVPGIESWAVTWEQDILIGLDDWQEKSRFYPANIGNRVNRIAKDPSFENYEKDMLSRLKEENFSEKDSQKIFDIFFEELAHAETGIATTIVKSGIIRARGV